MLNYRTIDLPFGGGVDDKTHPHLLNAPAADSLINMRFFETGAYIRRPTQTVLSGPASGTVNRIADYDGTPLALTSEGALRYVEGTWRSMRTQGPRAIEVRRRPVVRSDESCRDFFSCAAGGLVASVWNRRGSFDSLVWFQIADEATGGLVYGPVVVAGIRGDETLSTDGVLNVFPIRNGSGQLFFVVLGEDISSGDVATVAYGIVGDVVASGPTASVLTSTYLPSATHVDAQEGQTSAYMATWNGSTAVLARLHIVGTACVEESSMTITGVAGFQFVAGVFHNADAGRVMVFGQNGASLDAATVVAGTLSGTAAVATIHTADTTDVRVGACVCGASRADGSAVLAWDAGVQNSVQTPVSSGSPSGVRWIEVTSAGALAAGTERRVYNANLLARPFLDGGRVYIPMCASIDPALLFAAPTRSANAPDAETDDPPDGIQADEVGNAWVATIPRVNGHGSTWVTARTGYLVEVASAADVEGRRVAEFAVDVARRAESITERVPMTFHVDTNSQRVAIPVSTDTLFLSPSARLDHTADVVIVDMNAPPASVAYANGAAIFGAGYLSQVDGERHDEVMQCPAPALVLAGQETVLNETRTGSIGYRTVWAWRDKLGNVHRSAPSDPIVLTDTNGFAFRCLVAIPPFLDAKANSDAHPTDAWIEVYQSPQTVPGVASGEAIVVDGQYFRILGDIRIKGAGNTEVSSFSGERLWLDELRDVAAPWQSLLVEAGPTIGTLPLYTNGGVIPADPMPPPLHVVSSRDRVWMIDSEDRYRALYSAPVQPQQAPRFSQEFFVRLPTEAGELTALGVIADSLVLFSRDSVHMLETIDGPDSTGQGAFPPLREISREIGCVNARSVVSTDVGVMFQADSGIHLIDASGGLTHIGRDVQPTIEGRNVIGAHAISPERQVIWDLDNGTALVFDVEVGAWSIYDHRAPDALSTAVIAGEHWIVDSADSVYRADNGDDAEEVTHGMTTGWIKLAGLQGYQRIRRIGVLGRVSVPAYDDTTDVIDLGKLVCTVRRNYDQTETPLTYEVTIRDLDLANQIDPLHHIFRLPLAWQKSVSVKIGVTYVPPSYEPVGQETVTEQAASVELSGLALEVGARRGLRKIAHTSGVTPS